MFLSEAIEAFLIYLQHRRNRTDATIDTYRSALGLFMDHSGDILLDQLTPAIVDGYADYLIQFNYASKTYRNRLTPIRSMVKHFYAKNLINMRPESIDLPQIEETEANFLSHDEQIKMVQACIDLREKAIVLTLIRTGVRVSELINLLTDDLFDRSVIVRKGKGKKPRITFISRDAEEAIDKYHASLKFDSEYLICGKTGKMLSRQYVNRLIVQIADRAGLKKKVTPHTMRHTCATNLLQSGARVEDVQKILGHANIRNTLIYMHFTNDYLKSKYDESTTIQLA